MRTMGLASGKWVPVFGLLALQLLSLTNCQVLCPMECRCITDKFERNEVLCTAGGLRVVPVLRTSGRTHVIRVEPALNQSNSITLQRPFGHLYNLEELHVVNSKISSLGDNTFMDVATLRVLNVSGNDIRYVTKNNLIGLIKLEVLDLSYNIIEAFDSNCFSPLTELRSLKLSWNRITKLPESLFQGLHKLETLDLSGNLIRVLEPNHFMDTINLSQLKCQHCRLESVDPLLYEYLPNLQTLDVSDNYLKYFKRGNVSTLAQLKKLHLTGNKLKAIFNGTFQSLRLNNLSLASNRIIGFDSKAFFNSSVENLDLSSNNFKTLNLKAFQNLQRSLKTLNLNRNSKLKLASLTKFLANHPQLTSLSLKENNYERLPLRIFNSMTNLEHLDLSSNHLKNIQLQHVSSLRSLWMLDLSNNKLKGIDEAVFKFFAGVYHFDDLRLNGNPWVCDLCHVSELLKWILVNHRHGGDCSKINDSNCLRCSSPQELLNQPLISLNEDKLKLCNDTDSNADAEYPVADEDESDEGIEELDLNEDDSDSARTAIFNHHSFAFFLFITIACFGLLFIIVFAYHQFIGCGKIEAPQQQEQLQEQPRPEPEAPEGPQDENEITTQL